jgi:hypothetical protein
MTSKIIAQCSRHFSSRCRIFLLQESGNHVYTLNFVLSSLCLRPFPTRISAKLSISPGSNHMQSPSNIILSISVVAGATRCVRAVPKQQSQVEKQTTFLRHFFATFSFKKRHNVRLRVFPVLTEPRHDHLEFAREKNILCDELV